MMWLRDQKPAGGFKMIFKLNKGKLTVKQIKQEVECQGTLVPYSVLPWA